MNQINQALLLAAGLGERMRPLTDSCPKPLLRVGGATLIDALYEKLTAAGVQEFAVNAYHLAEQITAHFKNRPNCRILIESQRLETGGAVANALQMGALQTGALQGASDSGDFGGGFWVANSDSLWQYDNTDSLQAMRDIWDPSSMDGLLMLCPLERAFGYHGSGDFATTENGALVRYPAPTAQVFCGVQILNPQAFQGLTADKFSLNVIYDRAIEKNRLFGYSHQGDWWHVGTPQDLQATEKYLAKRQ